MPDLQNVGRRNALKLRRDPYWMRLSKGNYLGFRRMSADGAGNWSVRAVHEVTGKRVSKPLGDFAELTPSARFDAARAAAQTWLAHLGKGGSTDALTVKDACRRYVDHLGSNNGTAAAHDARKRFERHVLRAGSLASTPLEKLTARHIAAWRKQLEATPVVEKSGDELREKQRSPSAINRDMTALRAALNLALADGAVTSDHAWKRALVPIANADRARDVYLDREQRAAFVASAEFDVADFLRVLCALPFRPGAVADLNVSSFEPRLRQLRIGKDKSGRDRLVVLPAQVSELFERMAAEKAGSSPLLSRADGKRWTKERWVDGIRKAASIARLPAGATAYAIRHSVITDLIHNGLDTLTVAQLSGTSLAMIEKHYGHLTKDHATEALSRLML